MDLKRFSIFLAPAFIFSLFLLLLNDLYFKYVYGNWITGKLSDFSGLFLFALFLFSFFPQKIKVVAFILGGVFIFWKSPFSIYLINFWNSFSAIKVNRVVDYSDLIALGILPLAIFYFERFKLFAPPKFLTLGIFCLSLFAITGTSSIPYWQTFRIQPMQDKDKIEVLNKAIEGVLIKNKLSLIKGNLEDICRKYRGKDVYVGTCFDAESKKLDVEIKGYPYGSAQSQGQRIKSEILTTLAQTYEEIDVNVRMLILEEFSLKFSIPSFAEEERKAMKIVDDIVVKYGSHKIERLDIRSNFCEGIDRHILSCYGINKLPLEFMNQNRGYSLIILVSSSSSTFDPLNVLIRQYEGEIEFEIATFLNDLENSFRTGLNPKVKIKRTKLF